MPCSMPCSILCPMPCFFKLQQGKQNPNLLSHIMSTTLAAPELPGPHMPKAYTTWKLPSDDRTQLTGLPPLLSHEVAHGHDLVLRPSH